MLTLISTSMDRCKLRKEELISGSRIVICKIIIISENSGRYQGGFIEGVQCGVPQSF